MIVFRQKEYSDGFLESALKGASIGASAGTLLSGGMKYVKGESSPNPLHIIGGATLLGTALGALHGAVKGIANKYSRSQVDKRLLYQVLVNLKEDGYVEGKDFTRDPKLANLLRTPVCLVISRDAAELKLLVNTSVGKGLDSVNTEILKSLPQTAVKSEKKGDKYNELNISVISNKSDENTVTWIIEKFIKKGFPVYLIEVG